jgi:hypothetical protein
MVCPDDAPEHPTFEPAPQTLSSGAGIPQPLFSCPLFRRLRLCN